LFIAALVALAMVAGALALQRVAATPPAVSAATATPVLRPQAHGQVRPVAQARVGTLAGGVVASITVDVGDAVGERQEIARVRGQAGTEVLTAPIRGTIAGIPVHVGDTLLPGTIVATVADASRLQVETTDVDEFLIARVRAGQRVALTIDALDRETPGQVRTVALEPTTPTVVSGGDANYLVTIDLLDVIPDLRPGMTVRVLFPD
jgi:multidrug efflux pump subunit AcrA (membrane-fusion protein)